MFFSLAAEQFCGLLWHFTAMVASACFSLELTHSEVSVQTPRIIIIVIISTIIYDVPNPKWLPLASAELPQVLADKHSFYLFLQIHEL